MERAERTLLEEGYSNEDLSIVALRRMRKFSEQNGKSTVKFFFRRPPDSDCGYYQLEDDFDASSNDVFVDFESANAASTTCRGVKISIFAAMLHNKVIASVASGSLYAGYPIADEEREKLLFLSGFGFQLQETGIVTDVTVTPPALPASERFAVVAVPTLPTSLVRRIHSTDVQSYYLVGKHSLAPEGVIIPTDPDWRTVPGGDLPSYVAVYDRSPGSGLNPIVLNDPNWRPELSHVTVALADIDGSIFGISDNRITLPVVSAPSILIRDFLAFSDEFEVSSDELPNFIAPFMDGLSAPAR
ncbi:MAG: hypothetical protein KDK24_06235 [Pseudooceanicola sp.]|nr:hypothetical protein [Pseudooceanicola sp.]